MKANYRMSAAIVGALGLTLLAVPNCAAQCGGLSGLNKLHTDWLFPGGQIQILPAVFSGGDEEDRAGGSDPIVGLWHVKFVVPTPGSSETTTIDAGYAQWHSDGTEIMNSGARAPSTSNFCLGVWENVGKRQYKLNHFAISWSGDPSATGPTGPVNIREEVTLNPDGNKFTGTFEINAYDEYLNVQNHAAGTVTGTRITVDTPPQSIF